VLLLPVLDDALKVRSCSRLCTVLTRTAMQDKRLPRTNATSKVADPVPLRPTARQSKRRRAPYEEKGTPALKHSLTVNSAMDVRCEHGYACSCAMCSLLSLRPLTAALGQPVKATLAKRRQRQSVPALIAVPTAPLSSEVHCCCAALLAPLCP
jgi:hypothetical protein